VLLLNSQKFKTKIKKKTLNPVFNETFTFDNVKESDLLIIEVFDQDIMGKDEIIGKFSVNLSEVPLGKEDKKLTLSDNGGYLNVSFYHLVSLGKSELEIKQSLLKTFENSILCDAVALVEDKTVKVHKCILSRSPVLKKKCEHKEIEIKGKLKIFKFLCGYLYTDNVNCEALLDFMELSEMANDYELFYLKEYCIQKAVELITELNVHEVLEASYSKSKTIFFHSIKYFKSHPMDNMKTKTLSKNVLYEIVTWDVNDLPSISINSKENYLSNYILEINDSKLFSDLKLITLDKKEFQSHKVILYTHSKYFKAFLEKNMKDIP
jgi:hypothetical protein